MKRRTLLIITMTILISACQSPIPNSASTQTSIAPTALPSATATFQATSSPAPTHVIMPNIEDKLKELGGKPCPNVATFTCVTLPVPLDHFDNANQETLDVVFAVAPATGERKGMFVQAFPGGPGGEGISYASRDYFSPQIWKSYDIVFFDQRGLGLSNPLECKTTYARHFLQYLNEDDQIGEEGYDTPDEQEMALQSAKSFVDECIAEIGINPGKLEFFTTDQVAEDIESFRQAIGDDKFMLYGVSYGTLVAQTYARAHPDHLSGLILDGTQDTTLSGDEAAVLQWEAMNRVLLNVFEACDADPECSALVSGDSQAAYDELAEKLAAGPITYAYSFPAGRKVEHNFTLHMLDYTASYQLYRLESRMNLMRAVASAIEGDILPMARLYFEVSNIDPATGQYEGDPNFSDTMFYIVWCGDLAYYSGTSEERSAKLMQEIQKRNELIPRLDVNPVADLTCPYWPHAPSGPENLEPLRAPGVPTFVLNATLDPATPFHEGKTVFENLENGYHLYVNGGFHGIYGWGHSCPDQHIQDFLVNGTLPDQHEIVCDWGDAVLGK